MTDDFDQKAEEEAREYWHNKELEDLQEKLEIATKTLEKYASGELEHIVEVNGKKYFINEFGCGCCTHSYDVDEDDTRGNMNCELDNVAGWLARETLKHIQRDGE